MDKASEFKADDFALIQREFAGLKEAVRRRNPERDQMEILQKAFELANSVHNGVRRSSGEPYILHPIYVAKIAVTEIGLGTKSACASLLHDVVEDSSVTIDDIANLFGDQTAAIVDGLNKIKTVLDKENTNVAENCSESLQNDSFRRILMTLNDDVRVVLIKLADRLDNCRHIERLTRFRREKILYEIKNLFIPLSHRLGLYGIKSEMENIWLRFREPEAYNQISSNINALSCSGNRIIEEFLTPIRKCLNATGISYTIKKRIKTPYSIWNKIRNKHISFEQIEDMYAVRIIFDPGTTNLQGERNECFRIFSMITSLYEYVPERIRDWVTHPKSNGYEALHLTALTRDHTSIEVQIRSTRMNDIAEKGIAAHWNYKRMQPKTEESSFDFWLNKIKDILDDPDVDVTELLNLSHDNCISNDILIFDHDGRQHSVPKGATALDYAYLCGKQTGNHALAAKIAYTPSPLSYKLRNGDSVEIITTRQEHVKEEWLEFVTTESARDSIKEALGINKDKR